MEYVIKISNSCIKDTFEKCGIAPTREHMEKLDVNETWEQIRQHAFNALENVIKNADPDTFISQKQYDQMVGSFSLDDFHCLADTEFREVASENYQGMEFAHALYNFENNEPRGSSEIESAGRVFCHFLECVLDNFLFENGYFTDDEFEYSVPDFYIDEDQELLEFHCVVDSIFIRNNRKVFFKVGYIFTNTDIESEKAFQTALSAIEDNIKSQIIGVYQNESDS
ncbi:hypothetical protein [Bacillus sp. MSP13]|uniref:hypothetical protein n=1 Tax=Bacillus sp. MSP13 TaxID=1071061 RepID=UPI00057C30A4|nr:hypothetical protein [Bacillus sp. MSP13]